MQKCILKEVSFLFQSSSVLSLVTNYNASDTFLVLHFAYISISLIVFCFFFSFFEED